VDYLIRGALKNGGRDNITAVLVSAADDAPVKISQSDTVPINTEELGSTGFLKKLRTWLKRTFL